jgi:transposase
MDPLTTMYLGLDVAKAKVDCALLLNGKVKSKVVPNNQEGFETLKPWLAKKGANHIHACCEATGTYSEAIALYL